MNEWKNFPDNIPELVEREYLVTDGENVDVYWWKHFRSFGRKQEWSWNDRDEFFDFNVTHWMNLPLPPEKNEQ